MRDDNRAPPDNSWGGAPLAPPEVPYPEDHPNSQMLKSPPAPPPVDGPLGGLLSTADLTPPCSSVTPLVMWLTELLAGLTVVRALLCGWSLTAGDNRLLGTILPLVVVGVVGLLVWFITRTPPPVTLFTRLSLVGVVSLLILEKLSPEVWSPVFTWAGAGLGLVLVVQRNQWAQQFALGRAPLRLPHQVARVISAGASLTLPMAVMGGSGEPSVHLLSQLFSFSLICHAFIAQRTLLKHGGDPELERAASLLRVGELSHAWRWVLWLGCLIPLLLAALGLRLEWMAQAAWCLGGVFASLGLPLFTLLWLRASIRASRRGVV